MLQPKGRTKPRGSASDGGDLFGSSLVRDDLSRISEGIENTSAVSSVYYSVASALASSTGVRDVLGVGGGRVGSAAPAAATPASAGGYREKAPPPLAVPEADSQDFKQVVKAFVESGVRGRSVEVLRRDGQSQAVLFRLSRRVDAFEIVPEGGRASQSIDLTEVTSVAFGGDPRVRRELEATIPGLDERCAVVDLRDGRCLTLRFGPSPPGAAPEASEANVFARCMRIFVHELQREREGA